YTTLFRSVPEADARLRAFVQADEEREGAPEGGCREGPAPDLPAGAAEPRGRDHRLRPANGGRPEADRGAAPDGRAQASGRPQGRPGAHGSRQGGARKGRLRPRLRGAPVAPDDRAPRGEPALAA